MTSRHFQYFITNAAKSSQQHIVLPEGEDWRVIVAAAELLDHGVCKLTILGQRNQVTSILQSFPRSGTLRDARMRLILGAF